MVSTSLRRSFAFHLAHGGYCTPPGRAACAKILAESELLAKALGWTFVWEEQEIDSWVGRKDHEDLMDHRVWCPRYGSRHTHVSAACLILDQEGEVRGALSGILDPDRDYRRVVEAQLAQEYIPTHEEVSK